MALRALRAPAGSMHTVLAIYGGLFTTTFVAAVIKPDLKGYEPNGEIVRRFIVGGIVAMFTSVVHLMHSVCSSSHLF